MERRLGRRAKYWELRTGEAFKNHGHDIRHGLSYIANIMEPHPGPIPALPKLRFLDSVRAVLRLKHMSYRTEEV